MTKKMEEYLLYLKEHNYAVSTVTAFKSLFNVMKVQGDSLKKEDIIQFKRFIRSMSIRTRWVYMTRLNRFLIWSESELCRYIDIPILPKTIVKDIPEQNAMLGALQKPDVTTFDGIRDRTILEVLYATGLRRQELINLVLDDVDIQRRTIRVLEGKYKRDRYVPMSDSTTEWLAKYIQTVREGYKPITPHVFVGKVTRRDMSKSSVNRIVTRYCGHI